MHTLERCRSSTGGSSSLLWPLLVEFYDLLVLGALAKYQEVTAEERVSAVISASSCRGRLLVRLIVR
jgi:hypothetical protein